MTAADMPAVSGSDVPARPTSLAGWVMVPLEPTMEMGWAYVDAAAADLPDVEPHFNWAGYRAMLAASPPLPQEQGAEARDAARYRWLRDPENECAGWGPFYAGEGLDAAIDAAMTPVADSRQAQMGETK